MLISKDEEQPSSSTNSYIYNKLLIVPAIAGIFKLTLTTVCKIPTKKVKVIVKTLHNRLLHSHFFGMNFRHPGGLAFGRDGNDSSEQDIVYYHHFTKVSKVSFC